MMKRLSVVFLSVLATAHAFVPLHSFGVSPHFQHTSASSPSSRSSRLFASFDDKNGALAARTDVRNFLTQRALQSFIFLLIETRDPHTVTWMEDFAGFRNLENYHGTGALNMTIFPTWDSFLLELMTQPMGVVIVRAKRRGRGHGGWSKNNPYLEERFVDFEIEIDPVSLASRIMSVREQLAAEWATDLDVFISANDGLLDSYHDRAMSARDNDDDDSASSLPASGDNSDDPQQQRQVFDRTAMVLGDFGVFGAHAPSPLRKGNFDLLVLLATQESVHRVLREYMEDGGEPQKVFFEWLREFYSDRLEEFFDGNGGYGRADDFLQELLLTAPSVKKNVNGKADLIDPLKIAEDVIRMRTEVALDWKTIVSKVPEDHTGVRKVLLAKQMQKWGNGPGAQPKEFEDSGTRMEGGEFQ